MSLPHETSSSDKPTFVRYSVLTFLCVLAFIFYVDRICIGQAEQDMRADLGFSKTSMGYVMAAFTLAYSLFEVPMGWWGDKYGSRGVLTRIVIWWSAFTALTGAAMGLPSLIAIRFLFGAGEAGAFPNTARILSRWFPVERRGMAQGLVNSMAQVGGAAAPILTAYLINAIGWRWTFATLSIPGVIWAAVYWWWYRDDPLTHPAVNEAERQLIQAGTTRTVGEHPPIPWRAIFRHRPIWVLGFILACSAFNSYLYFTWFPTYLKEGRGVEKLLSGKLASIVLAGGAIGCLSGGFVIDWLTRVTGDRKKVRRRWCCSVVVLAAISLLIGKECDSPVIATLWTAGSLMFTVSTLAAWWGAVTDISGRHLGALFGLMNSLGGVGAIASQLFVGRFADWMKSQGHSGRAQWDPMFYVYAGILLLAAVGWWVVDSTSPLEKPDEAPAK